MRRLLLNKSGALAPNMVALLLSALCATAPSALAVETSPAAETATGSEFALENDAKDHESERAEIEKILNSIEEQWNNHNLDAVMGFYADDYVNNDGLDKKAVSALTQDFWKTYPDAKSFSKVKQIRIEGNFATIESRDMASGSTAKEMPGIGSKGDLKSISEGQLYMKKVGNLWKIIGDRIDYEKVKVAFGMAKNLNATFSAPEQVKSGNQYSAKLELNLPPTLQAVGSITSQPLEYPQPAPADAWRPVEGPVLERIQKANNNNRNELLMATIGITNQSRNNLMGIEFLTRRLNVVPKSEETPEAEITADAEKAAEKTEEKERREDEKKAEQFKAPKKDAEDKTPASESTKSPAPGKDEQPEPKEDKPE
ncbi:MAG TPA: nuclear transport factor 2 family protein [Planktothrix sp.]